MKPREALAAIASAYFHRLDTTAGDAKIETVMSEIPDDDNDKVARETLGLIETRPSE